MAVRGEAEFLNLPFQEKLEFLYGLPARQKRDLIISAPEAERLVQSFSPETLFYTLKEIGAADSGDLLAMAVPEQFKGLLDLDCWNKDQPNLDRMRVWIEAMSEAGRRRMAEALVELDVQLVTLWMRQYVKVYRLDEAQAVMDVPSRQVMQFDEHYVIEFVRHDSILPFVQEFLEEVFERDYDYFSSLMEEIYWGVDAELEEEAYQFRRARLNDRGFPDYFDAQDIFAYLDPAKFEEIRRGHVAPSRDDLMREDELSPLDSAIAISDGDNTLLNIALVAGFATEGKRQLRSEMALVTNQVLVARSVDFGDLEAVRIAVELTHNYMNLGLEHLAGGELQTAIENLRATHLKLLFRLGVSLTIDLRKRAEVLVRSLGLDPAKNREIAYFDTPYREALTGFLRRAPLFFGGLDTKGAVMMRDFRQIRDLHLAYAALDQIETLPRLFKSLLDLEIGSAAFRAAVAGRDIRLSQLFLTAMVQLGLSGQLMASPIAASSLGQIREKLLTADRLHARLTEPFRDLVTKALSSKLDEETCNKSANFVASCLSLIEEEFSDIPPGAEIDPRFIKSILLRRN